MCDPGGETPRRTLLLATCQSRPELTPSDTQLQQALERRGVRAVAMPWDRIDPGALAGTVVCLRSTWDYHHRWPEFRDWLRRFAATPDRLWNAAETVLWNADKRYLRELDAAGIRIPRTAWFEPALPLDLARGFREIGARHGVLKPRVSATAHGTCRVEAGTPPPAEAMTAIGEVGGLLQEFVPEIQDGGELSLMFFDGAWSHAVRKVAAPGDFRVQSDFGGTWAPVDPPPACVAFAARALEAAGHPWVYARCDLVETAGGPLLMELELIEPELFLTPAAADRLAAALLRRLPAAPR